MLQIPKTSDKLKRFSLDPASIVASVKKREIEKAEKPTRQQKKRRKAQRSWAVFAAIFGLPTLLTIVYFLLIASDQYGSTADFSVRGSDAPSGDILGMMSGMPSTSTANSADSHIVTTFILSRELVEDLDKEIDLRKIFSRPEADYFAALDPKVSIEDLVKYWSRRVSVYYDTYTGIIQLEVRAFRRDDAHLVATHVMKMSEKLVNEISRKARDDAVRDSKIEVGLAETRLRKARAAIAKFRNNQTTVDPVKLAETKQTILSQLDGQLVKLRTELNGALATMSEKSPRVIDIRQQIGAVKKQLDDEKSKLALQKGGSGAVLSKVLSQYEELKVDQEFAQKAYVQAQAALDAAKMTAMRQNRYLATIVHPRVSEEAQYPERLRWILIVAFGSFMAWGILMLGVAAVKEHMA